MNDFLGRLALRYRPWEEKKLSPYLTTAVECYFIDASYEFLFVPGVSAGAGIEWNFAGNNSLFLEAGYLYAQKDIHSHHKTEHLEVYYSERWKAPPYRAALGWRYRFAGSGSPGE